MPINQPRSALARADCLLEEAIALFRTHGDTPEVADLMVRARGALGFAGNSQTKLINAGNMLLGHKGPTHGSRYTPTRLAELIESNAIARGQMGRAIDHASGPGID